MAAGTDSADPSPSSGGSDLEEGEFVAGPDDNIRHVGDGLPEIKRRRPELEGVAVDEGELVAGHDDSGGSDLEAGEFVAGPDDDIRQVGDGLPEIKRRRLDFEDVVVDGGVPPSPTPSCDCDSDETISDVNADAGAANHFSLPLLPILTFPCPVCRRVFTSRNGLSGHMNAHGPYGRHQVKERPPVTTAISGDWAVTGERGSVGGRSVSPESEVVVDSMATVVSEPVLDPMPIAFARGSSSAEPNPPNDDSMAILVASSEDPTSQPVVQPPCSPQFLRGNQPAAPQSLVAQAQPTVAQGQQLAEEAARQFIVHQAAVPQVVAHHVQCTSSPPPARDEQGLWLSMNSGLSGHMAGQTIRKSHELDAAGLHLGVGDPGPAKMQYPCKHCPRVFTSGGQLGGHMAGVCGRGARSPKVSASELASALALSLPMPPATTEVTPAQPAVAPAPAPVRLRLFGVDIVVTLTPPAAAANEASSAVTETDQSFAASTDMDIVVTPPAAAANEASSAVTETDQSSAASTDMDIEQ